MTNSARRAAVLGHPIAHSLSPVLHRAAYAALGLEGWRYDAVDVDSGALEGFVGGLDASWAGLSLTMPLKHTILPMLDHVEPLAELVGAVNTVLVQGGPRGSVVLTGANTDVFGIVTALREGAGERALPAAPHAVVLGSGATAASTLAALGELGCPTPTVFARSLSRVGPLRRAAHQMGLEPSIETFGPRTLEAVLAADVVVSTAPAHGMDELAAELDAVVGIGLREGAVLLDVIYEPRPTALMTAWRAAGGTAVGGERMLLHQAAEQVRLMTGRVAPVEQMDAALTAALD